MSFSAGINKIFLLGNIAKDGRKHTQPDNKLAEVHFCVVTEDTFARNGADVCYQEHHNIIVPGKIVNGEPFSKDRLIYLEGSVKTNSFFDEDGIKRYKTHILVNNYKFLS